MKNLYCRFCFDLSAAIVASPKGSIRGKFKTRNKIGSKDFFKHVSNINSTLPLKTLFNNVNPKGDGHFESSMASLYSRTLFLSYSFKIWCVTHHDTQPTFGHIRIALYCPVFP